MNSPGHPFTGTRYVTRIYSQDAHKILTSFYYYYASLVTFFSSRLFFRRAKCPGPCPPNPDPTQAAVHIPPQQPATKERKSVIVESLFMSSKTLGATNLAQGSEVRRNRRHLPSMSHKVHLVYLELSLIIPQKRFRLKSRGRNWTAW